VEEEESVEGSEVRRENAKAHRREMEYWNINIILPILNIILKNIILKSKE